MIKIFDGHNDTLLKFHMGKRVGESFFDRSEEGHIDLVRAQEGGFAGGFFAVFSPTKDFDMKEHLVKEEGGYRVPLCPPRDQVFALEDVLAMAANLFRFERASEGTFKVVRTAQELKDCLDGDVMAAIFHIEGAEAVDTNFDALDVLYEAGLRSLGPVWSRQNAFATGVPFNFPSSPDTGDGLTLKGKELIRRCNELGIMVDLSHMNEKGFWEVAKLSTAPLVATHSNVHALAASPRNLTDEQLEAIRDSDGMVGLNFAVGFLRADGQNEANTPLETMIRHFDYLIDKLGEDRVGFGSDFDGATISSDIKDVAGLPNLVEAMHSHGYDDALLTKLGSENWLRVLKKTWH